MKFLGTIIQIKEDNVLSLIDFPIAVTGISVPAEVFIGYSERSARRFVLAEYEFKKKRLNIRLEQRVSFDSLIEMGVFIDDDKLIFEEDNDSFFISDLIGCRVLDNNDRKVIGEIIDVYTMPANDVWIVKTEAGELPVPAVKEFIVEINIEEKSVIINIINGLMDLIEKNDKI